MMRFVASRAMVTMASTLVVLAVLAWSGAQAQTQTCESKLYPSNVVLQCGNAAYNPADQVCCGGTVHTRDSDSTEPYRCCGSEWVTDDQCCGGNPIVPETPFDPIRCCRGEQTYDTLASRCCADGSVLPTLEADLECCHNRVEGVNALYNTTSQRCCAGEVIDIPTNGNTLLCCETAFQTYDPGQETLACCETQTGSMIYDPTTHECCTNGPQPVPDVTTHACCGATTYDFTDDVCCLDTDTNEGVVYKERDDHACCGTNYVSTEVSVSCCGNKVLFPESSNVIKCCVDTVYNDYRHQCIQDSCRYCDVGDVTCGGDTFGGTV